MKHVVIVLAVTLLSGNLLFAAEGKGNQVREYTIHPDEYTVDLMVDDNQSLLHVMINGQVQEEMLISLINVRGQEAYYDSLDQLNDPYSTTIDLSQLNKGLYYFKIDCGDEIRLIKITI